MLPALFNRLPEDSILVAQTVAHCRQLHGGHGVEKASCQSPQSAIAEARIGFLVQQVGQIELLMLSGLLDGGIEKEVHHVVGQRTADEKLHRKVVNTLRILALVGVLGLHPALREDVPYRSSERLEPLA